MSEAERQKEGHDLPTVKDQGMNCDKELAEKLEAMVCNAPRAACGGGRCDCVTLRAAAQRLCSVNRGRVNELLRRYPPDGGLKEPVHAYGAGANVFDVIRRHFTK